MANNPNPAELRRLLTQAKTIAVVGASTNPDKEAHAVPAFLQKQGYRIVPVNPGADEIFGQRAYASLADIPSQLAAEIDIVNLFRPSEQVGPHVQAALNIKAPVIWLQKGISNEEWAAKARAAGATVVQNLCMKMAYQAAGLSSDNS